jgi:ArsR family transcriptional regulator, arsenate/arsenite/antimonite-responsive transcriptional repressor
MAGSSTVELSGAAGDAATLLGVLADPVRWSVLDLLADGQKCVCDLQCHVPIATNLLSYHLRVLREAGLVTTTKRGRWVDYALAVDAADRMRAALPGALVAATP